MSRQVLERYFANGVAREKAEVLYAVQEPTAAALFGGRTTHSGCLALQTDSHAQEITGLILAAAGPRK